MSERDRLNNLLDCDIDFNSYQLLVWGTGNTTDLYQEGLKRLEKEGIVVKGYFDNNAEKWGTTYNGKEVFSPESLSEFESPFVLVSSTRWSTIRQIGKQLDDSGIPWLPIDSFVVKTHAEQLLKVYDLLGDERSKHVYYSLAEQRVKGSGITEDIIDRDQYFYRAFIGSFPNEVFVDCGAYVGDSFEQYLWTRAGVFKNALLFEPDKKNVSAIEKRLSRLKEEWNIEDSKVTIYPYGIGDSDSINYMKKNDTLNGLSSKLTSDNSSSDEETKIVALDSVLNGGDLFIKADIESYEYKMILGLKNTIKKYHPRLAVCIYHNSVDFYSIPILLNELCPEYRFAVRHYSADFSETVLYAYFE